MNEAANDKHRGYGRFVIIVIVALLSYQFTFYLTFRSVVNSYGLGPVNFPGSVAHPVFAPARLLDEHVLRFGPRINKFMSALLH
jgi:hypothetical protein